MWLEIGAFNDGTTDGRFYQVMAGETISPRIAPTEDERYSCIPVSGKRNAFGAHVLPHCVESRRILARRRVHEATVGAMHNPVEPGRDPPQSSRRAGASNNRR
ncbi:hypothetical protein [Burkholderia pyrrocinia]|uniref:hypothetical protein n=1 Tax=Burkholderia pyrrocinia TaxID=60550 RepID=UPI001ABB1531|nr:hypothetical protein [Burkholderia pyrrocinia]